MQTVRVSERTGNDGVLHVSVPLGTPDADYEVVVVVQPKESKPAAVSPEDLGWPPGYFDLAGSADRVNRDCQRLRARIAQYG